jgi:hypothetical protein
MKKTQRLNKLWNEEIVDELDDEGKKRYAAAEAKAVEKRKVELEREKREREERAEKEKQAQLKRDEAARKEREKKLKDMSQATTKAMSVPSTATITRNKADSTTNELIKRAPDSVLSAKLSNPALFAPDRIRFKNAFGSMIKLPKDEYITGKFIAAVLSGAVKLLIFDESTKKFFLDGSKEGEVYRGATIKRDELSLYGEYTIPSGFNIQWIHQLIANTKGLMGYLLSFNSICYDFSYYMWIAMTIEPGIYTHMEFISRVFEKYASFSTATLGEKREDAIKADLWAVYEAAQGASSIQRKIRKMGDLKGSGSILTGGPIRVVEHTEEEGVQIKTNYRKINKLLIAPYMYSRLKSSTKSLLIQVLTAISFHGELPERYGKVVDGENFSLFELVKKSALTEKLYDASFDIISCMPIETKMLFMVNIVFKRLLYIRSASLPPNQVAYSYLF